MSGATGELTRDGMNREQDEAIQQLCQPQENVAMKRFSSSASGGKSCSGSGWQREDNEKSLSQL
jgi:hypothetical protein